MLGMVTVRSRSAPLPQRRSGGAVRGRRRMLLTVAGAAGATAAAFAAAAYAWSGATLAPDGVALARVHVEPFGGEVVEARALPSSATAVPLDERDGLLTPRTPLRSGVRVAVVVTIRRPGWLGWALGSEHTERLVLRTPVARLADRWLSLNARAPLELRFDHPVSVIAVETGRTLARRTLPSPRRVVRLERSAPAGTIVVAAAARRWERLGLAVRVGWFPAAAAPVVLARPAPGSALLPTSRIRLTFSEPLATIFGRAEPRPTPGASGRWRRADAHTLVFVPARFGAGFADELALRLPRRVALSSDPTHTTRRLSWTLRPASVLRLQQLLAQAGYLPLDWRPSGPPVAATWRAQLRAAVDPPAGTFTWRYSNTPRELEALWREGVPNTITRGAVLRFQDAHRLTVDGYAGEQVWRALIADTVAGKRSTEGYSYVYVHTRVPQSLTLWHNGRVILTSPGNTGVPAAPTQLGTFPVFEHIPVGTMSGTNPDGSHYYDPGVRYISYFNGGDAIHAFNRASFGTPQSLGCVELPLPAAAKVWPYTPIGTLVTVEP